MNVDYVVVGAGLFGLTVARLLTDMGFYVRIYEKRDHIGGNCWSTRQVVGNCDIDVHEYGPHIFHTDNKKLWDFVNKYETFEPYDFRMKSMINGRCYSFPINLMTLNQLYGISTPEAAVVHLKAAIDSAKHEKEATSIKDYALRSVGEDLYRLFYEGYCTKQWGADPSTLPMSIIKRIPYRITLNDKYYPENHKWIGLPKGGWNTFLSSLGENISIHFESDFFKNRDTIMTIARLGVIYTGEIDEYFDHKYGKLNYRSLTWRKEYLPECTSFQGNSIISYPQAKVPFTRIIEHKHFKIFHEQIKGTVLSYEYPVPRVTADQIPMYPIRTTRNKTLYSIYKNLGEKEKNIWFGGRLATYTYLDMDECIDSAIKLVEGITNNGKKI